MSQLDRINRRSPPTKPANFDRSTWPSSRRPISKLWDYVVDAYSGIPGGFKNITPTTIMAGVAGAAGQLIKGWAAANHTHAVLTAEPVELVLGADGIDGDGPALVASDSRPSTVGLFHDMQASILDEC